MQIQEYALPAFDQAMRYAESGEGEPLVLVHGALADHRLWYPHISILSGRFRCLAPTQRNFGSAPSFTGPFGVETHLGDLAAFVRELNLGRVRLLAWSYGADVALAMAVRFPELVQALFLYEPGFPGYLEEAAMGTFMSDAQEMFGEAFALVEKERLEDATRSLIDGSGGRTGYFDAQAREVREQQLDNAHTIPLQLHQSETPPLNAETLAELAVPTVIAYGQSTRRLFRLVSQAAATLIPGAREVCVPGATHMLPIEAPRRLTEMLLG